MAEDIIRFKRKMYDTMLKWKQERNGDTALLIQGARRVGKSTIAEEFARNEYKSYILIDFSKVSKEVSDLFNDISDLNYLFIRLQFIFQVELHERESVIIFDEVQLQPMARQAIKHLVKDHRYDYIETGSLISVRSKSKNIVIPSEETKVNMYDLYSLRANSSAIVDLPTRRAPCMSNAVSPLRSCFHLSIVSYIFLLKRIISSAIVYDFDAKI